MDLEKIQQELAGRKFERRYLPLKQSEFRLDDSEDKKPKLVGYAALFNQRSEDMGFIEMIRPGAFAKTIRESDVRALFNHESSIVLGRNRNQTLSLVEDDKGLAVRILPPATTWATDVLELVRRGDVDQMSFGFRTLKDSFRTEGDKTIRELVEVQLFDVSVVTYPAYPQTEVALRSALEGQGDLDGETLLRILRSRGLTDANVMHIVDHVGQVLRAGPVPQPSIINGLLRRKLDLAAMETDAA